MNKDENKNLVSLFSTRGGRKKENEVDASATVSTSPENLQRKTSMGFSAETEAVLKDIRSELGEITSKSKDIKHDVTEKTIVDIVEKNIAKSGLQISDMEKAGIIIHLQKDLLGWGILQPLIDNPDVTDIHVYDYSTVVLQKGKVTENTQYHWPSKTAYLSFLDRLLLRLGKSLSTQQHTVDAAFPDGIRICAIHESVCGARGPLLCIRIPRISKVSLESIVSYGTAPAPIVKYLAALIKCGLCTFMVAGETGTGKTTLIKCLATQFGLTESIVSIEDTPELNFTHPYYRSLISRPPNSEGAGEVTLQEHIKTTLRMTPTRVILGEMRTPLAGEAFLEGVQTGHVGMSTIHARSARETLTRLEGLLGRAQKSVSIEVIRQQIAMAVDVVVWLFRDKETGRPRIGEIIEVGPNTLEGQFQTRPMFSIFKTGKHPVWKINSWSSYYDDILSEYGIYLSEMPSEMTLDNL